MTDYPNLSEWNSKLSSQANGFALWFGAVVIICLYILWSRRRWPLPTRLVGMGIYLAALLVSGVDLIPALLPIGLASYLIYKWSHQVRLYARRISPIGWLLLAAFLIRLPGLWTESLWYDETFTAGLARLPFQDMMTVIRSDVHPPLWYIIERLTVQLLGSSEAALRFPSLLFGVLVVWLIYRLAVALRQPRQTALVAAALVAVLPAAVHYSHEARGYSLLAATVLLMTIGILENKPLWFILGGVVALYTHNLAWFYFGVLSLATLARRRDSSAWLMAWVITAAVGGLWLPVALQQSIDISDGFWLQTANLGDFLRTFVYGTMYVKTPEQLLIPVTGGIIGLSVFSAVYSLKWLNSNRGRVYLLMVLGAPALIALVSVVWHNVYIDRALLASSLGLSIVWSRLFTQAYKGDRLAVTIAIAPLLVLGLVAYYNPGDYRIDARTSLPAACQGTDTAYTTTTSTAMIAHYYLPHVVVWPGANDLNQQLPSQAKTALGWQQSEFDELAGIVCLIDGENALSKPSERSYVQSILDTHDHRSRILYQNDTQTIRIHIVETGP